MIVFLIYLIFRNNALASAEEAEFRHLVHEIRSINAARAPQAHHHKKATDIFYKFIIVSSFFPFNTSFDILFSTLSQCNLQSFSSPY